MKIVIASDVPAGSLTPAMQLAEHFRAALLEMPFTMLEGSNEQESRDQALYERTKKWVSEQLGKADNATFNVAPATRNLLRDMANPSMTFSTFATAMAILGRDIVIDSYPHAG